MFEFIIYRFGGTKDRFVFGTVEEAQKFFDENRPAWEQDSTIKFTEFGRVHE
jgi:hypothetical protein